MGETQYPKFTLKWLSKLRTDNRYIMGIWEILIIESDDNHLGIYYFSTFHYVFNV